VTVEVGLAYGGDATLYLRGEEMFFLAVIKKKSHIGDCWRKKVNYLS